jgi:hypothetical protein
MGEISKNLPEFSTGLAEIQGCYIFGVTKPGKLTKTLKITNL